MHYDLELFIDLKKQVLEGKVTHTFRSISDAVTRIVLDTRAIKVNRVYDNTTKITCDYYIADFNYITDMKNEQLVIDIGRTLKYGDTIKVTIEYSADKTATAVNWVPKEQTFGKEHEFMYTQCEAIQCRSIVPLQDTPSVKSTFTAALTIEKPYKAIASAVHVADEEKGNSVTYKYEQKIPVPSYLLALVAGEIDYKKTGERAGVYAEPKELNKSAEELSEMDDFLNTIESIITPYVWGHYSVVIMPPSFPYGGMENPYLTFVSPSIIIGDKSSANVVAHEICHSWFGNQITGKNWSHFWLNEGFTVYSERLIAKMLKGEEQFTSQARIGGENLETVVKSFIDSGNPEFTKLFPNVYRLGPDDIMSNVAYEKGFLFLVYLEEKIGAENFYKFLRTYLASYSFKSIEVWDMKRAFEDFVAKLPRESLNADPKDIKIEWDTWIFGEGIPDFVKKFDNKFINESIELADYYLNRDGTPEKNNYKDFSLDLRVIFMRRLLNSKAKLNKIKIGRIDHENNITETEKNPEVQTLWYQLAILNDHEKVKDEVEKFLKSIGRQKYIVSIYQSYIVRGQREYIKKFYCENRKLYHPIAQRAIDREFGGNPC